MARGLEAVLDDLAAVHHVQRIYRRYLEKDLGEGPLRRKVENELHELDLEERRLLDVIAVIESCEHVDFEDYGPEGTAGYCMDCGQYIAKGRL